MPALTTSNFDVNKLIFTEAKPNKNGGKYATIGYGDEKNQVQFQLGAFPDELLYCKWGVDHANPNDDGSDLQVKLDLTGNTKAFLQKVEQATLAAAEEHSISWFKKKLSKDKIASMYKPLVREDDAGQIPDRVWIKAASYGHSSFQAKVTVIKKKGDKYAKPVPGTFADVKESWVVPVIKIRGGVYFMNGGNFGTSLVATEIVVIKEEGAVSSASNVNFDGIVFEEDAEMVEVDEEGE